MKIGLDASILSKDLECGLKTFQKYLLINLSQIDKKNQYYIFSPRDIKIKLPGNFRLIRLPHWMPIFKRQIMIPLLARRLKLDIFHFPDVWGSIIPPCKKTIITIHDLAPSSSYPSLFKSIKYFTNMTVNRFIKYFTINNASVVIVPSLFTKNEFKGRYNSKSKNIAVVYDGLSEEYIKQTNRVLLSKSNYFLAFSDFSPRKNIPRVLEAYKIFLQKNIFDTNLVCICSSEYSAGNVARQAANIGISDNVKIEIGVSMKKLINYYRHSLCLIYPSLYEGFGLPILEAMSCGCPVVTSNYGAMKEISNRAALLINPHSLMSISKSMEIILNKALRKRLINKGLKIARKFTWRKNAIKTLHIYQELYKEG